MKKPKRVCFGKQTVVKTFQHHLYSNLMYSSSGSFMFSIKNFFAHLKEKGGRVFFFWQKKKKKGEMIEDI
jgi:hypothetical protein